MVNTRKYYRIRQSHETAYGIELGEIEVMYSPGFFGGEDLRMYFNDASTMRVKIQKYSQTETPYWFVTGYEFLDSRAFRNMKKFAELAEDIAKYIAAHEEDGAEVQLDLSRLGYIPLEYVGAYYYPANLAPTETGYKWIMYVDYNKLMRNKFRTSRSLYKYDVTHLLDGTPIIYLGYVYADTAEEASKRIQERLVNYEGKPELYEAYLETLPEPMSKFEVWPRMQEIFE